MGAVIGLIGAFVIRSASARQGGIIKMLSVVLAIALDPTTRRASQDDNGDGGDQDIEYMDMDSPIKSGDPVEMKDVEIVSSS